MYANQEGLLENSDYDVLLILDACRYDIFKQVVDDLEFIEGDPISVYNETDGIDNALSMAESTPKFYEKLPDHIDITEHELYTANPVPFKHFPEYEWKESHLLGSINPYSNFKELKTFSIDSKAIIHLVPPHLPWMSGDGRQFIEDMDLDPEKFPYEIKENSYEHVVYSRADDPMKYYREQVEYIVKCLAKLWDSVLQDKNVVITSDHSEGITEEQGYSHIRGVVPWMEIFINPRE